MHTDSMNCLRCLRIGLRTAATKGDIEENAELREACLEAIDEPEIHGPHRGYQRQMPHLYAVYASKVQMPISAQVLPNQLRSLGLYDRSIIVIMSDHGDEFMEHGAVDHGATLYQEQLHTVLMMRIPYYTKRNDICQPVRSLDIFRLCLICGV